jgi:hypothetical protein
MDPNATLALMMRAHHDGDELQATEHALDLAEWLASDGFAPDWSEYQRRTFRAIMDDALTILGLEPLGA